MENTSENPALAPDPAPETIPAPAATHHPRVLWAVVASTLASILSVCFLLKKLLEAVGANWKFKTARIAKTKGARCVIDNGERRCPILSGLSSETRRA